MRRPRRRSVTHEEPAANVDIGPVAEEDAVADDWRRGHQVHATTAVIYQASFEASAGIPVGNGDSVKHRGGIKTGAGDYVVAVVIADAGRANVAGQNGLV